MDLSNLKIIKKLKDVSPKLKLALKNHMQDLKIKSRYIDFLIPEEEKDIMKDAQRIEDMVRETLVQEFSEKIFAPVRQGEQGLYRHAPLAT